MDAFHKVLHVEKNPGDLLRTFLAANQKNKENDHREKESRDTEVIKGAPARVWMQPAG